MKDFLKEEIKKISDKINFLRNIFLALLSGIVGIIFGFSQNKIIINSLSISLFFIGILVTILLLFRINLLEKEKDVLILKLKDLE